MTAKPRREEILKLLGTTSVLSVGELADHFALSVVTIRKDLDDLASEGPVAKNVWRSRLLQSKPF